MSEQDREVIELVVERVAEKVARAMVGIVPDRVYPPEQAAELIGIDSQRAKKTLREIPRALLPDVPVTANGGKIGYLGRDLLAYIQSRRRTA